MSNTHRLLPLTTRCPSAPGGGGVPDPAENMGAFDPAEKVNPPAAGGVAGAPNDMDGGAGAGAVACWTPNGLDGAGDAAEPKVKEAEDGTAAGTAGLGAPNVIAGGAAAAALVGLAGSIAGPKGLLGGAAPNAAVLPAPPCAGCAPNVKSELPLGALEPVEATAAGAGAPKLKPPEVAGLSAGLLAAANDAGPNEKAGALVLVNGVLGLLGAPKEKDAGAAGAGAAAGGFSAVFGASLLVLPAAGVGVPKANELADGAGLALLLVLLSPPNGFEAGGWSALMVGGAAAAGADDPKEKDGVEVDAAAAADAGGAASAAAGGNDT